MKSMTKDMGLYEWLLLLLLSVIWGGSFFFVEIAVTALPPLTIVALRVTLASLALLVIVHVTGLKMVVTFRVWGAFLIMGVLNNVIPFTLIVWGQSHITSGLASVLNATTPLFTLIAAHFLTRDERMTGSKTMGVLLGFAGVFVMIGHETVWGAGDNVIAELAVLAAALSYALAGIFGRRFAQSGIKPVITAAGQVTASSVILIPLALLYDKPTTLAMIGLEIWLAVLGLALISTAFAYILYFRILASAGATNLLLVTLLIPVTAIMLGTAVLGERLASEHMVGMVMITLGLLAIDGRLFSRIIPEIRNRIIFFQR